MMQPRRMLFSPIGLTIQLLLCALFLAACTSVAPSTPTPKPLPTATKTPIPEPTATPVPTATPEPWAVEGWELVWQDEFDGSAIDDTKWSFEVNGQGGGNNELQY